MSSPALARIARIVLVSLVMVGAPATAEARPSVSPPATVTLATPAAAGPARSATRTSAALKAPSGKATRAKMTLTTKPRQFTPGKRLKVAGRVTGPARTTVALQLRTGKKWSTRARTTTGAKNGKFSLGLAAPRDAAKISLRLVATAPKAAPTTKSFHVGIRRSLTLVAPPRVYAAGHKVTLAVKTTGPAKRVVKVQRKNGSRWSTVATKRTSGASTVAKLSFTAPRTGSTLRLRATTAGAGAKTHQMRRGKSVSVSLKASQSTFLRNHKVSLKGVATHTPKGRALRLERYDKGSKTWKRLRATKAASKGAYKFTFSTTQTTTQKLRVVVPEGRSTTKGTSRTLTLGHRSCGATAAQPAASTTMAVWFNDPSRGNPDPLAARLRALICAAAPGSEIRVMNYIYQASDRYAVELTNALRYVHTERGVRVKIAVETTSVGTTASTIPLLRRFATVTACDRGCFNTTADTAVLHDKLLSISKTTWRTRPGPVTVLSSSNWSERQLARYWQSATAFYGDTSLFQQTASRFDRAALCAKGKCSSAGKATHVDWVRSPEGSWGLKGDLTRPVGSGMALRFLPATTTKDNVLADLRSVQGCDRGGQIHVAMYIASTGRSAAIAKELGRLRKNGCKVSMLVSQGGILNSWSATMQGYRTHVGVAPRCVELMHLKYLVMTGVKIRSGSKTLNGHVLIMDGSQNWTRTGLRLNDETAFRLTSAGASKARSAEIRKLANAYLDGWRTTSRHAVTCRSTSTASQAAAFAFGQPVVGLAVGAGAAGEMLAPEAG